jgi:hypothetical protein
VAAELKATEQCFDTLKKALDLTTKVAGDAASGCAMASADFNNTTGRGLAGTADSGQKEIKATSKAKVDYFKAEAGWYGEHGKKGRRAEQRDLVQNVVDAIGKAAFDASGVYAALSSEASALRNNGCTEAMGAHTTMVEVSQKLAEEDLPALRKGLSRAVGGKRRSWALKAPMWRAFRAHLPGAAGPGVGAMLTRAGRVVAEVNRLRGKSGHHRARWSVTPTRGNPRESATEMTPPKPGAAAELQAGKGEMVR